MAEEIITQEEIRAMRRSYGDAGLESLPSDPFEAFALWLKQAHENTIVVEANAMVLSTLSSDSHIETRTVLLKDISDGGFTFFTNYESRKAHAIELNPQVIAACRLWFKLPDDTAKLNVVLGDAAEVASHDHWRGKIDALQVDLYDQDAACPVLDSEAFYTDCRQLLTDNGCMTVNLFGRSSSFESSVQKIANAFGKDALWAFRPTKEGNTILMALRTAQSLDRDTLMSQAQAIQTKWPLPATKWLKVLAPVALT